MKRKRWFDGLKPWQPMLAGALLGCSQLAALHADEPLRGPLQPPSDTVAIPNKMEGSQQSTSKLAMVPPRRGSDIKPSPETLGKAATLIADVYEPELVLEVRPNRSKLIRTRKVVTRTSVSDPTVAEVTQLTPTEFEIIGLKRGETTLTFWFGDANEQQEILRYLVVVGTDRGYWDDLEKSYSELQDKLNEMFPNSQIQLVPIANRVILRGQARDAEEATHILSLVRARAANTDANLDPDDPSNFGGGGGQGSATNSDDNNSGAAGRVINSMRVPHEHQILLRVRVAELSRSALRQLGVNFSIAKDGINLQSALGAGNGNLTAIFDGGDISLFIRAIASNGNSKILAEPNLVVLNGQTASFIAGGQFAVPTAVGVNGIGAATTTFQGFGTQLLFTPTLIDKDLVRLQVVPTFSTLNNANAVNGIPGLNTRSVSTTVDMRCGQWLAIAGLIEDEQNGSSTHSPGLGDIPFAGVLFSNTRVQRNETELIVMVSPELTRPLEEEQLPPLLPGMDVTEPDPFALYGMQKIEGFPDVEHRSTVYPNVRTEAFREVMRNAKARHAYQRSESFTLQALTGFPSSTHFNDCRTRSPYDSTISLVNLAHLPQRGAVDWSIVLADGIQRLRRLELWSLWVGLTPSSQDLAQPPSPLGAHYDEIWNRQRDNVDASMFVIYEHEFKLNGIRLNTLGEDHLKQIAARLNNGAHYPIVVERTTTAPDPDSTYKYPVHPNPELDNQRKEVVIKALVAMGVKDAEERVVVTTPYSYGISSTQAAAAYSNTINRSSRGGGGFGGGAGFGGGGGFGGFGGGFGGGGFF